MPVGVHVHEPGEGKLQNKGLHKVKRLFLTNRTKGILQTQQPKDKNRNIIRNMQTDTGFKAAGVPAQEPGDQSHRQHRKQTPQSVTMKHHKDRRWNNNCPNGVLQPPAHGLHEITAEEQFLGVALERNYQQNKHNVQPEHAGIQRMHAVLRGQRTIQSREPYIVKTENEEPKT